MRVESWSGNIQIINDLLLLKEMKGLRPMIVNRPKRQQDGPKRPTVLKAKPFWIVGPNRGISQYLQREADGVSGSQRRPV